MTLRILLLTFALILCGTISVAQDNSAIYKKLVDYVNCKYAVAYIDKKKSEIKSKDYLNDFAKYKNVLSSSVKSYTDIYKGIDNKIQNSTTVYDALKLSANGFPKAKLLWQYIDQKKEQYNQNWTEEQMIDFLILLSDDIKVSGQKVNFKSFLSVATSSLKADLIKQTPDIFLNTNEEIESQNAEVEDSEIETADVVSETENIIGIEKDSGTTQVNIQNSRLRSRDTNQRESKFPFGIIFFIVGLILLGYFGYKKRKNIEKLFQSFNSKSLSLGESNEIDYQNKCKELDQENRKLRDFEQQNALLSKQNKELKLRIKELEQQIQQKWEPIIVQKIPIINAPGNEEKQINAENNRFFADAIIGGEFHRISELPNEDTVYELYKSSSARIAKFRVYAGSHKRVIDTPDFVDGCDKQKINPQPQDIQVEPGEAILDENGKWKITKKANIKFI
jgi:hypothetical protein